jgi:hypothetical protein
MLTTQLGEFFKVHNFMVILPTSRHVHHPIRVRKVIIPSFAILGHVFIQELFSLILFGRSSSYTWLISGY